MAITPSQWSHKLWIPDQYIPPSPTTNQTLVVTDAVIDNIVDEEGNPASDIFWNNVNNGGGDVRFCLNEDGSSQLPLDIPNDNLDRLGKTCVIWTLRPTYNGLGGMWCFIGKAGETQPPVTDPFGRNAVWAGNAASYQLNDDSGTDSTGTNDLPALGATTTVAGVFGDAQRFATSADRFEGAFSGLGTSQRTLKVWVRPDSVTDNRYLSTFNGGTRQNLTALIIGFQSGNFNVFDEAYPTGSASDTQISATALQWQRLVYTWNGSTLKGYINGVEQLSVPDTLFNQTPDYLRISPTSGGGSSFYTGAMQLFEALDSAQNSDYIATEYANQSDPASFFGTPTIAETGGGGAVTADAAYTIAAPTFAASAGASLPQPTADGAFSIASPLFSANADASLPQPVVDAAFTLNAPTFSASATATIPGFNASIAYSVNAPTFTADATVTLPSPTADVAYTVTAPTFSVDSAVTLPQPTANAAFSLPAPTFAASATATETGFNAAVNFTLPAPTFSADATATLPQPIADGNFTITAPTFSVVAIVGGIAIIVDDETNINQRVLSNNINAPILSNNING